MDIGKRYNFDTLAPAILGSSIKGAKYKGSVDYETACKHQSMIEQFRAVYPHLPAGTLADPAATVYHLFTSQAGEQIIYADVWINKSTITLVETVNLRVDIANCELTDSTRIRDALTALNITNFTITSV